MRNRVAVLLGLLVAGGTVSAQQYLITTVAGGGLPPTPAPATSTALPTVGPFATGPDGSLYLGAGNCVFKVDASGTLTRIAGGSAFPGYSGDGGLATIAQLNPPSGLAVDAFGNVYIADSVASVIRKVAVTGIITLVAGTGKGGQSGDGGPATSAQLDQPRGLAVDAAGNLYIADRAYAVRKVTAATGIITRFAGNGTLGDAGDGGPALSAQFFGPLAVTVDGGGNVYILDASGNDYNAYGSVRKVAAATGIITTVAAGSVAEGDPWIYGYQSPQSVAVDNAGNLYVAFVQSEGHHAPVVGSYINELVAATGITQTVFGPSWNGGFPNMAVAGPGSLYLGSNWGIQELTVATGVLTTVAGNAGSSNSGEGGPAAAAQLGLPSNVAVDGFGNLYIACDSDNRVHKMEAATGIITTVAGGGSAYPGDNGPATSAAISPSALAADRVGNFYIAESYNNRVRKVAAATGVITTVAGDGTHGYSGDGGPGTSAQLWGPAGVAVDGTGNVYIADSFNHAIRKVAASTGIITTVAGTGALIEPAGMAVDGSGNIYFVDSRGGLPLEVAAATGSITPVSGNGNLASSASVAVDASGSLYVADSEAIWKVAAATGITTRVAGNGTGGYSGDGGPAASAQLNYPAGVAVDGAGNVYIADYSNGLIRMLVPVATRAVLSTTSTHAGEFARGLGGASYSIVVSNSANAGPTSGTVTVTEKLPAGLTLVSMAGAGWNCSGAVCTRGDVLSPGASYPVITVTVNVEADAPSQATNEAIVSGGGSTVSSAADLTAVLSPAEAPALVSPANGACGVLVAPTLVWDASADAASYDVYFGASSTQPLVMSTAGTSYAPGPLNPDTTYYWQIVARNGVGSASFGVWSFTTGVAPIGALFVPVAPCRVADTRRPGGPFGGPTMTARSMRSFTIPSSGCSIPASAQAYSLNVTVVPSGPLSYLTLWPVGQAQPVVSTLNSLEGIVVANAAIVPAGTGGAVNVFVAGQTDVILDINGYFDSTAAASGSSFYTATPCRVADTRRVPGQFGGPPMVTDQVRDFPIPLGACGIPAAANAYSLNVTAVPGTDFLAYLTTFPTGASRPFVSTLDSWTGRVVANAAIVPVGSNESVSVFVTDPANVILDINGYFGRPGDTGALTFYPVTPCRAVDTRRTAGPFGGPEMEAGSVRSFAIPAGACPVPSNAAAYSLNVTVVPDGPLPYLTAWPTGAGQPFVSTLNSFDGSVVANAAIVPAGMNGAISIYVPGRTHVILDINGYFAP